MTEHAGKPIRIAVAGASGYAGGEVLRLLLGHPRTRTGARDRRADRRRQRRIDCWARTSRTCFRWPTGCSTTTTVETLAGHDVVFLGLPHGHSARIAKALPESTVIIDCGADFRLTRRRGLGAVLQQPARGQLALRSARTARWPRETRGATRIAVPGCYPDGVEPGAGPGGRGGYRRAAVHVVAVSGTSGAGRAQADLLGSEVMGSVRAYGVGGVHRHTPEIIQNLSEAAGQRVTVSFTPVLAPMPRGILATCTAATTASEDEVRAIYEKAYADEPFVHLLPEGVLPQTGAVVGSNAVQIAGDGRRRRRSARGGRGDRQP